MRVSTYWFFDLDTSSSCGWRRPRGKAAHFHAFLTTGNAPIEKIEFVDQGEPETAFATEQKTTTTLSYGTRKGQTSVAEMRVAQLVEGPLDPGLFTVPAGFRQVKQIDRDAPRNPPDPWRIAWEDFKASAAALFR